MNNEKQLETLQTFAACIDEITEISLKAAKDNSEDIPPHKVPDDLQNAYINSMADMIFFNPYVLVKTYSADKNSKIFHYIEKGKEGKEYHSAVIFTDESKLEENEAYTLMPFVDFMKTVVDDPILNGAIINPTEERKYFLLKDMIKYFLQFANIEFIGL